MKQERQECLDEELERLRAAIQEGQGLALRLCREQGLVDSSGVPPVEPLDYRALRDALYEERLDAYHAYHL